MSEKLTLETVVANIDYQLTDPCYDYCSVILARKAARTLIDGIREMEGEIKQDKKAMEEAIQAIQERESNKAMVMLETHLAKDQPKDNGAGGKR